MNKERRNEIRVPLIDEACVWLSKDKSYDAQFLNITIKGIFIKSEVMPQIDEVIEVRFPLPSNMGIMPVKAKVIWRRWASSKKKPMPLGFGIQFLIEDGNSQKVMDAFVTYLRNKQIIKISKRIIEEFNNRHPEI